MTWEEHKECVESLASVYDFDIEYIQPWHLPPASGWIIFPRAVEQHG
jgi:hypothetical protein